MSDTDHTPGPMDSLIADFHLSIKRLKATPLQSIDDVNRELVLYVYPSFIAVAEQIAEVDDVIQEVVDQQDSYVQPELAAQIFATIAAAGAMAEEIKRMASSLDDMSRKKLLGLVKAFEHSAQVTVIQLSDAVTDGPGDDEGDPEVEIEEDDSEEDDSEEDDSDNNSDDELTPVEIPTPRK